jgi:hypothetical protein
MKKLAIALAACGAFTLAIPAALACGGHGESKKGNETKTAEKTDKEKSKEAPAKKAPAKKEEGKKDGDKVSMK